ncbi:MAG: helix-turn-helix domain-containing protein [Dysosmobacter sp.]
MTSSKTRLRDLREDRDLTQKDVAAILGTTYQYYQKYESGKRPIPVDRLEILADFYQTSVDYLLGRTPVKKPYPKK